VDPDHFDPGHFYDLPGTRQGFVKDKTNVLERCDR
jgi:iron complex outermembrane receptor protein